MSRDVCKDVRLYERTCFLSLKNDVLTHNNGGHNFSPCSSFFLAVDAPPQPQIDGTAPTFSNKTTIRQVILYPQPSDRSYFTHNHQTGHTLPTIIGQVILYPQPSDR